MSFLTKGVLPFFELAKLPASVLPDIFKMAVAVMDDMNQE